MNWSDATRRPDEKLLRQFAVLCIVFFSGLAAWRAWRVGIDATAITLVAGGGVLGLAGLVRPASLRYVYSAWIIAVFPIGWTVSHVLLATAFYLVFTPIGWVFRLSGRDVLRRRRGPAESYWTMKESAGAAETYFRQF
jgi:hypothetical protein